LIDITPVFGNNSPVPVLSSSVTNAVIHDNFIGDNFIGAVALTSYKGT